MTTKTQNARILKHLKDGGRVTALSALERFQCFRLASRICDLKAMGHDIKSQFIETESGKRVKVYWL